MPKLDFLLLAILHNMLHACMSPKNSCARIVQYRTLVLQLVHDCNEMICTVSIMLVETLGFACSVQFQSDGLYSFNHAAAAWKCLLLVYFTVDVDTSHGCRVCV